MSVVNNYLHILLSMINKAAAEVHALDRHVMPWLQRARLYQLSGASYSTAYAAAEDARAQLMPTEWSGGALPFPSTFIGYAGGVVLSEARLNSVRHLHPLRRGTQLIGHLIVAAPSGIEVYAFLGNGPEITGMRECLRGQWSEPADGDRVALPTLIAAAMKPGHASYTPLTNLERRDVRLINKRGGHELRLQPYYRLSIPDASLRRSIAARQSAAVRAAARAPDHAYDSRAHQRLLVLRGSEPLPPQRLRRLLRRGWQLHTSTPSQEVVTQMVERGHAVPQPGEWIAVKSVPVRASIKGALAGRPYMPAVRVIETQTSATLAGT